MARLVKKYEVILDIFGKNKKGRLYPFLRLARYLKYLLWIFSLYWLNQIVGEGG